MLSPLQEKSVTPWKAAWGFCFKNQNYCEKEIGKLLFPTKELEAEENGLSGKEEKSQSQSLRTTAEGCNKHLVRQGKNQQPTISYCRGWKKRDGSENRIAYCLDDIRKGEEKYYSRIRNEMG